MVMVTHRNMRDAAPGTARDGSHRNAGGMNTKLAPIAIGVPVTKRATITQAQANSAVKRYLSGATHK